MEHLLKILTILIVAWITNRYIGSLIKKIIKKKISEESNGEKGKRATTLISIFVSISRAAVWIFVVLIIFSEIGINIGPLLAGAGIVGLAFGLGAKRIIEDFLGGLFIILEDQYGVGDEIKIGDIEGIVKDITLRRTIIKDKNGTVHSIPNGEIKITSNKSKS